MKPGIVPTVAITPKKVNKHVLGDRGGEDDFKMQRTINLPPVVRGDILGVEEDATVVES